MAERVSIAIAAYLVLVIAFHKSQMHIKGSPDLPIFYLGGGSVPDYPFLCSFPLFLPSFLSHHSLTSLHSSLITPSHPIPPSFLPVLPSLAPSLFPPLSPPSLPPSSPIPLPPVCSSVNDDPEIDHIICVYSIMPVGTVTWRCVGYFSPLERV